MTRESEEKGRNKYEINHIYSWGDRSISVKWTEKRDGRKIFAKAEEEILGRINFGHLVGDSVKELDNVLTKVEEAKAGDLYYIEYRYRPDDLYFVYFSNPKNHKSQKNIDKLTRPKEGVCLIWVGRDGSHEKACASVDHGDVDDSKYKEYERKKQIFRNIFDRLSKNRDAIFKQVEKEAFTKNGINFKILDVISELKNGWTTVSEIYYDVLVTANGDVNMKMFVTENGSLKHPKLIEKFWEESKDIINRVIKDIREEAKKYMESYGLDENIYRPYIKQFDFLQKRVELSIKSFKEISSTIYNEYIKIVNPEKSGAITFKNIDATKVAKEFKKSLDNYYSLLKESGVLSKVIIWENEFRVEGNMVPADWRYFKIEDKGNTNTYLMIRHTPVPKAQEFRGIKKEVEEEMKVIEGKKMENLFY